ncbi:MAG: hypothetical protein MUC50_02040 [Myxococcota bacterium]|jgi:hypothetical protein|nr:hypothetical protein [Myxococcota bacterium]
MSMTIDNSTLSTVSRRLEAKKAETDLDEKSAASAAGQAQAQLKAQSASQGAAPADLAPAAGDGASPIAKGLNPSQTFEGLAGPNAVDSREEGELKDLATKINSSLQNTENKANGPAVEKLAAAAANSEAASQAERRPKPQSGEAPRTDRWSPSPDLEAMRKLEERAPLEPSLTTSGPAGRARDAQAASLAVSQASEQIRSVQSSVLAQANLSPQIALGLLG